MSRIIFLGFFLICSGIIPYSGFGQCSVRWDNVPYYVCPGSSHVFNIVADPGVTNISWSGTNCSVWGGSGNSTSAMVSFGMATLPCSGNSNIPEITVSWDCNGPYGGYTSTIVCVLGVPSDAQAVYGPDTVMQGEINTFQTCYSSGPMAAIALWSQNFDPGCSGHRVSLTTGPPAPGVPCSWTEEHDIFWSTPGIKQINLEMAMGPGVGGGGCPVNFQRTVVVLPDTSFTIPDTSISFGDTITLDAGHYQPPYLWSDSSSGSTIEIVCPGTYVLRAGYPNCYFYDTIHVTDPMQTFPQAELPYDSVYCYNPQTISPGSTFSSFLWSTGQVSPAIGINQPGSYFVEVADSMGCKSYDTTIVDFSMFGPHFSITPSCPNISNGILTVDSLTGAGTGNYQVALNNSPFSFQSSFDSLSSGIYHVQIIDLQGCYIWDTVNISNFQSLTLSGLPPCSDSTGWIQLIPNGIAPPFEFSLDGINFDTISRFAGTTGDLQHFYFRDSLGCVVEDSFFYGPPLSIVKDTTICHQDTLVVFATQSPYQYVNWMPGASNDSLLAHQQGQYSFLLLDTNGFECRDTFSLSISDPVSIVQVYDDICPYDSTGYAMVYGDNGVPPYFYYFEGQRSSNFFPNLSPGTYSYSIVDYLGCTSDFTLEVGHSPIPSFWFHTEPASPGQDDGSLGLWPSLGGSYQFSLDGVNFQSSNLFQNLSAGIDTLIVVDSYGCWYEFPFYISTLIGLEKERGPSFSVFPNPAMNRVAALFNAPVSGQISVFDSRGDLIYSNKIESSQRFEWDISHWTRGIYWIVIETLHGNKWSRFAKQ